MTPANDNKSQLADDPLSRLPLFATDRQIALAIVGKARADYWSKFVIPVLEKRGFPIVDPLHEGRPVPLVRKFYEGYFGLTAGFAMAKPDGEERLGQWKNRKKVTV